MTQAVLRPHDQLTHDEFTAISKAVHEFEALWRQTRNPAIEPFLPEVGDPLRLRLLIELLRIDQEHRWEHGEHRLLEQYLQDWPELAEQPAAIQELLDAECLTRFCLEDSPTRDELRQRFPQFADTVDLDRLRATALAEKGEASTAKAGGNDATMINVRPQVGDELPPTTSFPAKSETSAVLAARRIGLLTGKQFGRYEVRRLVGTGGMGAVYEARDTQLERIVALKIPRSELVSDPVILQRFLNEARAAGAIRHPHICPIYDVGKIDGQHFITMPLVQGMSLSAWMEHRTVSLHEAVELTRKLASALQAIHSAGIRHRDIKASNVMIDERGEPLLMDFGLARLAQADTHVTQSGSLVGTPAYMAPEQIQLGASGGDERSDLYSLGVLLYQMLTGRLPFEGPMTKVLVDIATKDPPRLETLRPDVDPNLAAACRKAMAREPAQRFRTANEFEDALTNCLRRLETLTRPESQPTLMPTTKTDDAVAVGWDKLAASAGPPEAPRKIIGGPARRSAAGPTLRRRTLIAAALFFVLAAVIVVQISDRAELVIKSKVEGLEVKVIQLAQPEQERTLTIGENSVRVRSGQVEVVLTGANADEYEVVGDKITLKRFGREVVEIKRRETKVAAKVAESLRDSNVFRSRSDRSTLKDGTGWHGWSADAPPPAIAPFDAEQAQQHQEAWAKYLNVPVEYTNSIGMKFRLIPPGEFLMGQIPSEREELLTVAPASKDQVDSAVPKHSVVLTTPVYLGQFEVTQKQYATIIGRNPAQFAPTGRYKDRVEGLSTDDFPVEHISWKEATEFCDKLSQKENLQACYQLSGWKVPSRDVNGYRLPTEAQWEFACRAGSTTKFWTGDDNEQLLRAGWFNRNSGDRPQQVGGLKANPFGLNDTHGNVSEWCQDRWSQSYYARFRDQSAIDPEGPTDGTECVIRGGEARLTIEFGMSSHRTPKSQVFNDGLVGFRIAFAVDAVRQALKVDGAKIVKPGVPVGANGNPVAEQGRSAWDDLDPAQIPEAERVPRQPEGLVAVLGQHRRRVWNTIRSASVSADGSQYTLTTNDGLYLFDRDLKKPARFFPGTSLGGIHSAAFLPDGRLAMFNPESDAIELQVFAKPRDDGPLEKQSAVTTNCKSGIFYPMASSDGRWIAAYDDTFEKANFSLWRLSDAAPQRAGQFALPTPHGNISPGCFSPDAQWFCFTDNHNTESAIHLIDLRGDTPREVTVLKAEADEKSNAPAKGFKHAVFLADGRLATADHHHRIWFWKLNEGEPKRLNSLPLAGADIGLYTATKSLRLACYAPGSPIWDLSIKQPKQLGTWSPSFPADNVAQAVMAPDGNTFFTSHHNGAVRLWGVTPNGVSELDPLVPNPKSHGWHGQTKVVGNLLCGSPETDRLGTWRPTRNGLEAIPNPTPFHWPFGKHAQKQLLIVNELGSAGIQLLRREADQWKPFRRINAAGTSSAALNDSGRRLAFSRHNGMEYVIELWGWESDDSPARKLAEVKVGPMWDGQLAFAEEGRTLVSRQGKDAVEIWNVQEDRLVPRAKLPPNQFHQIAVAPNGRTLAIAGYNKVEVWNLTSDLQQPTASFAIHAPSAVAFSPDGKRLAASFWENGASAGVQIIHLSSGVVEKRLTFPGRVDQLDFTDDSRHLITANANGTIYVVRLEAKPPSK